MSQEYKNNSYTHRMKEAEKAEKQIEKVVRNKVKTKKKSELTKLTDIFVTEDINSVKSYVFMDIVVPAIKKAISDVVTNGVDMILYGETGRTKKTRSGDYVSYRSYSDSSTKRRSDDNRMRSRFDFDDIVFDGRGDAEAVLEQMDNIIDRYGMVSVADMYDMADLTQPYTAHRYGWTNLRGAEVVRVREGYIIKLPKAMPID